MNNIREYMACPGPIQFGRTSSMGKIEIDETRCKGCALCTISCPKGLIRIGEQMNQMGFLFALWTGEETCTGCAICGEICPDIAIRVWK